MKHPSLPAKSATPRHLWPIFATKDFPTEQRVGDVFALRLRTLKMALSGSVGMLGLRHMGEHVHTAWIPLTEPGLYDDVTRHRYALHISPELSALIGNAQRSAVRPERSARFFTR